MNLDLFSLFQGSILASLILLVSLVIRLSKDIQILKEKVLDNKTVDVVLEKTEERRQEPELAPAPISASRPMPIKPQATTEADKNLSYDFAKRILETGGNIDEIMSHCNITHGEAELLSAMHGSQV